MIQYGEKLSELLFIELKDEAFKKTFNYEVLEPIDVPIRSKRLIDEVKDNSVSTGIPISYILEGITFVLAADPKFKHAEVYKKIIMANENNLHIIKKVIAEQVKEDFLQDAYILLKGLVTIEPTKENYEKLLVLAHEIWSLDKGFIDEEVTVIEQGKLINGFPLVYYYEALLKQENDVEAALFSMNQYIAKGGEITEDITKLIEELRDNVDYMKGKELAIEEPEEALVFLLPLLDKFPENPSLYFYISIAYRNLKSHEQAILYLNEAFLLDNNIVEIINELGLNYASIGDYQNAINYFRKGFEATRSIEMCTNLILCYYNMGDINQAKLHLEIAKKINSEDEIVNKLQGILDKNSSKN